MDRRPAGREERTAFARLPILVAGICIPILAIGIWLYGIPAGTASTNSPRPRPTQRASREISFAPAPATAAFGLDLMRTQPPGNLVLSPDSVATALAMAGTGAAGRTASQIAKTLHLATPAAFAAVGRLQSTIASEQLTASQGDPKAPTLDLANGSFPPRRIRRRAHLPLGVGGKLWRRPPERRFLGGPVRFRADDQLMGERSHERNHPPDPLLAPGSDPACASKCRLSQSSMALSV